VIFGKKWNETRDHIVAPGSCEPTVSTKEAKYLGAWLDYNRSSREHVLCAEKKAASLNPLLYSLAQNVSTEVAFKVMDAKVAPHALYGLEATWPSDGQLSRLDASVTGVGCMRAALLPVSCRKEIRMYQSPSLHASRQVRLAGARFAAKLARDTNPIRQALLHEQLTRPTPRSGHMIRRANSDLASVLGPNPLATLVRSPSRGPNRLSQHRLDHLLLRVKRNLCDEQTAALTQGLPALGESGPKGRKSSYLFSRLAAPIAVEGFESLVYAEAQRVVCVTHPFHRQQVQRVRYGTMATPINPNHNVRSVGAAASRRARYAARPSRPVSVSTPTERAAAALVRAASLEARRVEALRVPLCNSV
jgi:hypothetical protein